MAGKIAVEIKELIKTVAFAVIEQKELLTDLDREIGDGDHGINMAHGFEAVLSKLDGLCDGKDLGGILKALGMCLLSNVGGTAGALYGTALMRAGGIVNGKTEIDAETGGEMLAAALKGIQDRGKAAQGEKTMVDALIPACEVYRDGLAAGKTGVECLGEAVTSAEDAVEYTKTIIATKGRASYLGERSLGHQDPGATSTALMLKSMYGYLNQNAATK